MIDGSLKQRKGDLFVRQRDSGPMNLAAVVSTPAFDLFGSNPSLEFSKFIHAILPDDGGPRRRSAPRATEPLLASNEVIE
jgi:ADP-heptose:LPS heptosyltransferase